MRPRHSCTGTASTQGRIGGSGGIVVVVLSNDYPVYLSPIAEELVDAARSPAHTPRFSAEFVERLRFARSVGVGDQMGVGYVSRRFGCDGDL